jgi:hypothetical protein
MRNRYKTLFLLLIPASMLQSATLHVPAEYGTIQEGMSAASEGDTILVSSGTYSDSSTVIKGFTIQNGIASELTGAGISCWNASPLIVGNIIADNSSGFIPGGGASFLRTTSLFIIDNLFLDNSAGGSSFGGGGGGLYVYFLDPPEDVVITGNTFNGNTCLDPTYDTGIGGGMVLAGGIFGNPIEISSNEFIGNIAEAGGGIWLGTPGCYLGDCTFSNNSATMSGGGAFIAAPDTHMNNCTVTGNFGDGLWFHECSSQIRFCSIFNNDAYGAFSTGFLVDCKWNWWDDSSGPGGAGPGTGDEVCLHIPYDPWLTEESIDEGSEEILSSIRVAPDPFSSTTTLSFDLQATSAVTVHVFDL